MRQNGCTALLDDCAGTSESATAAMDRPNAAADDAACLAAAADINRYCPSTSGTDLSSDPCTISCADVFIGWWDMCVDSAMGQEVDRRLGVGQLPDFYRRCSAAVAAAAAPARATGSGH
jgi:hypothetical protein